MSEHQRQRVTQIGRPYPFNLLPWRDRNRLVKNRQFYIVAFFLCILSCLSLGCLHLYIEYRLSTERQNNEYLSKELEAIQEQFKESEWLQANKKSILKKMHTVDGLQAVRFETVKLLNALSTSVPNEVCLNSIRKKDHSVDIEGQAKTNAGISQFLRNIDQAEENAYFLDKKMVEIVSKKKTPHLHFKVALTINDSTGNEKTETATQPLEEEGGEDTQT